MAISERIRDIKGTITSGEETARSILNQTKNSGEPSPGTGPSDINLIDESFMERRASGTIDAPEILLLELFRECFYNKLHNTALPRSRMCHLSPSNDGLAGDISAEAGTYALRGRAKKMHKGVSSDFYAPSYPNIAQYAWFRKGKEVGIRQFLFRGPLRQHFCHKNDEVGARAFAEKFISALKGSREDDFLWILAKDVTSKNMKNDSQAVDDLLSHIYNVSPNNIIKSDDEDILAATIFEDLDFLCDLESQIPRQLWLQLLMTFLRIATPIWLLAQMELTIKLHEWIVGVLDQEIPIPSEKDIIKSVLGRNEKLLQATIDPSRALTDKIEFYVKCRIELINLIVLLSDAEKNPDLLNATSCLVTKGGGATEISVKDLLNKFDKHRDDIIKRFKNNPKISVRDALVREGERFKAWKKPLDTGVGDTIKEFFATMRKYDSGDDGAGYLLEYQKNVMSYVVFPGHRLMQLFAFLAGKDKQGQVLLSDIEDHFSSYGVDFSVCARARSKLTKEYQRIGLLKGSPDAQRSAAVSKPFGHIASNGGSGD